MMNRALPEDIRILECVEVPETWNARFDCLSREYMYFFMRRSYDVTKMDAAARLLEGKHDYRNICKLNVVQQENYVRRIHHAGIYKADHLIFGDIDRPADLDPLARWQAPANRPELSAAGSPFDMFYLRVRGSGFLWHQIRCIMTLLFSIGEGHDAPELISDLLDVEKTPAKPGYPVAPGEPLLFSHCEYRPCPFGQPVTLTQHSAPGSTASAAFEAAMVDACHQRVALAEVVGNGAAFFAAKRAKTAGRSVLHIQSGKTIEQKILTLKGNKKKRYDNVQDWKERMLTQEGALRGRSRSRSQEKDGDAGRLDDSDARSNRDD